MLCTQHALSSGFNIPCYAKALNDLGNAAHRKSISKIEEFKIILTFLLLLIFLFSLFPGYSVAVWQPSYCLFTDVR